VKRVGGRSCFCMFCRRISRNYSCLPIKFKFYWNRPLGAPTGTFRLTVCLAKVTTTTTTNASAKKKKPYSTTTATTTARTQPPPPLSWSLAYTTVADICAAILASPTVVAVELVGPAQAYEALGSCIVTITMTATTAMLFRVCSLQVASWTNKRVACSRPFWLVQQEISRAGDHAFITSYTVYGFITIVLAALLPVQKQQQHYQSQRQSHHS
jgi:hypothetical protein